MLPLFVDFVTVSGSASVVSQASLDVPLRGSSSPCVVEILGVCAAGSLDEHPPFFFYAPWFSLELVVSMVRPSPSSVSFFNQFYPFFFYIVVR